ncbi:MAG: FAD-binding oxidoreductase [Candidatus Saccharibacteria bacterium]|nr:FAD-binding oxidoreductase [Candidatus Saccharibacteria bacterium]
MNKVSKYINEHIDGTVFDRPSSMKPYSRDRSFLNVDPKFVVLPSSTEDIRVVLKFLNDLSERGFPLPIAVRGSGLDKTGADLSEGVVISVERLDQVLEVDENARMVRVQSGTTLGKLNAVLSAYGLTVPVDAPADETILDLISNYTLDNYSGKYNSIYYYTEHLEVALTSGDLIQTSSLTPKMLAKKAEANSPTGRIYRKISDLLANKTDMIKEIQSEPRNFGGYRMISKVEDSRGNVDLMPLFFGSNNTLGVITEIILRVEPLLRERKSVLAHFASAKSATTFAESLNKKTPVSINIFDHNVVKNAAALGKKISFIEPKDDGYYVFASFDDNKLVLPRKMKEIAEMKSAPKKMIVEDQKNKEDFTSLEKMLAEFLNDEDAYDHPVILDDIYIPNKSSAKFLEKLVEIEENFGRDMPVIGSPATELYSVRPVFNLSDDMEKVRMFEFIKVYTRLVRDQGGSLTGGSAEGRTKGAFNFAKYTSREEKFHLSIKHAFDPNNILNPEVKLGASLTDVIRHLKTDK